jgi:hypothetical protein
MIFCHRLNLFMECAQKLAGISPLNYFRPSTQMAVFVIYCELQNLYIPLSFLILYSTIESLSN